MPGRNKFGESLALFTHSVGLLLLVPVSFINICVGIYYAIYASRTSDADPTLHYAVDGTTTGSRASVGSAAGMFSWASIMTFCTALLMWSWTDRHDAGKRWSILNMLTMAAAAGFYLTIGLLLNALLQERGCPWEWSYNFDSYYAGYQQPATCPSLEGFRYYCYFMSGWLSATLLTHLYFVYEGLIERPHESPVLEQV